MAEGLEHEALERDIAELTEAAKERAGGTVTAEALKESIREKVYGPELVRRADEPGQRNTTGVEAERSNSPLPDYAANIPPEARLRAEELLDAAWHKGLTAVIPAVRKEDPFTMKLFHDAVTERLYQRFKERGILK
ncbi:MAG: hypothetical protein AAB518_01660 [Patescibacteria group bacterium]